MLKKHLYIIKQAVINAASAGDNEVVAAISGKKIRVTGIKHSCASDVTTTWKSDTGGSAVALGSAETFKAGGGMSDNWGPYGFFFETALGKSLNLYLSGAVQVSGWVNYIEM
jgi:hypothetical protein